MMGCVMRRLGVASRGSAYIATLMLFLVLMSMVTVALRVNARWRSRLRAQKAGVCAFYLAESGLEEAFLRLRTPSGTTQCERVFGRGGFIVTWARVRGTPDEAEIVSVGEAERHRVALGRKIIRVRVRLITTAPGATRRVRVLSRQEG